MGYSIIFETKIVKLTDGRIIHFDRSGCNNDTAGRGKDEFTATIYNVDVFKERAEHYKQGSLPIKNGGSFDLKIGSRPASMYDYCEHLLRMLKRAVPYDEFIKSYNVWCKHLKAIEVLTPEYKIMTVQEFDRAYYDLRSKGNLSYRRLIDYPNVTDEKYIVSLIDNNESIEFEIWR
nr:MAG TPA: hypothetical protein [Caudoviricetes sp.]